MFYHGLLLLIALKVLETLAADHCNEKCMRWIEEEKLHFCKKWGGERFGQCVSDINNILKNKCDEMCTEIRRQVCPNKAFLKKGAFLTGSGDSNSNIQYQPRTLNDSGTLEIYKNYIQPQQPPLILPPLPPGPSVYYPPNAPQIPPNYPPFPPHPTTYYPPYPNNPPPNYPPNPPHNPPAYPPYPNNPLPYYPPNPSNPPPVYPPNSPNPPPYFPPYAPSFPPYFPPYPGNPPPYIPPYPPNYPPYYPSYPINMPPLPSPLTPNILPQIAQPNILSPLTQPSIFSSNLSPLTPLVSVVPNIGGIPIIG